MEAMVMHREKQRKGRGFSCKEIEEAKLTCQQFAALKLPWDSRRATSYKENIAALKQALKK